MKVKRKISIHDFWNEKHDIITIEVDEVESGIEKNTDLSHLQVLN